jgi:uncharacterized radical SAM superfamily Fe-S cluster-containing enzyme
MVAFSEIYTKHINMPCGQKVKFCTFNVLVRKVTTAVCKVNPAVRVMSSQSNVNHTKL